MSNQASDSRVDAARIALPDVSGLARVHAGPRHNLHRGVVDGVDVVVKVAAVERLAAGPLLRREYELLRQVDSPGVVKALGLADIDAGLALVMANAGDSNLADRIRRGPLAMPDFLHVATQLAEAVADLHRARIAHRDIQPANIVWDAAARRVALCDLASASTFQELSAEQGGSAPPAALTYVSPEQTGRTGRSVDSRTDLYSLGATLYEMLLGQPPFKGRDAVELAHAQIARRPDKPHELRPEIPVAVSNVVLKLLEKEPEQRYQTADALAIDLREAQARLSQTGAVAPFSLATRDVPRELRIPEKLYGRDAQLATLEAAFARCGHGGRELVLITGAPGAGKSALVARLGRHVAAHGGLFVAGKFDQLQRGVPFSGLAQAFKALLRLLLIESESALATWRQRIEEAVEPNGRLLVEIVPELDASSVRSPH